MPSPFPGMDPYLENPTIFPSLHHQMISQIQGSLNRSLKPKYVACILLRQRLPIIEIPLQGDDPDAALDLQAAFESAYEFGAYDRAVDYRKPPTPPLPHELRKWAADLIRKSGM